MGLGVEKDRNSCFTPLQLGIAHSDLGLVCRNTFHEATDTVLVLSFLPEAVWNSIRG